jgi:hypothetical protein
VGDTGLLRRMALAALIGAIASGAVSIYLLMTGTADATFAAVSLTLLIVGLVMDRRAAKHDDRNAS